jgi:hypothetical protein
VTRLYIQPSWIDSCSDHGEWSGGNDQYRGDKSIEAVPTYINGKPNVKAFSDEAIEARKEKRKTSIPLVDRVLPQQRRVRVLTEQLYELEAERKNGMDLTTYSQLRDVLICKRDRAEVLLKKALSAKPIRPESEEDEGFSYAETFSTPSDNNGHGESYSSPVGVRFVDELPSSNSFKKPLKIACTVTKTLVRWSQQAAAYYKTLKEI